jgi:hypothetical protein
MPASKIAISKKLPLRQPKSLPAVTPQLAPDRAKQELSLVAFALRFMIYSHHQRVKTIKLSCKPKNTGRITVRQAGPLQNAPESSVKPLVLRIKLGKYDD